MNKKNDRRTHAYSHQLADMHLAVFAPDFTLSLCESENSRNPQVRKSSVLISPYKGNLY